MQNKAFDKKFSIGEASKFLGVSIDTLRRWEKAGKIKTLRSPGGHRYFLKTDLEGAFGQRYSRTSTSQDVIKPTQILQEDTSVASQPVPPSPMTEPTSPSNLDLEQATSESLQIPDSSGQKPDDTTNLTPEKVLDEAVSYEPSPTPEPITSSYPQTPEKRYTVEEITTPDQIQEPSKTHDFTPEDLQATGQSLPETPPIAPSEPEPAAQEQKFDEPLSSFNTPPTPPTQPVIQPSQTEMPEVTVTPQLKKGGNMLKKVSLFLLIVFMMVNIILIGFYIFVSKQL